MSPNLKELPVSEEMEALHKGLYDTYLKLAQISGASNDLLMSVHMELLVKYSKRAWGPVDDYLAYETYFKEWVDTYMLIRYGKEMDAWKAKYPDKIVEMECTLCGDKMHKPRETEIRISPKIERIEVEGCKRCHKGLGQPINGVTWFDKEGNILYHANAEVVNSQTLVEIQKIMDSL